MSATRVAAPGARPRWRSVAIPSEHGGWGLTVEPIVLGLLVEASWAGVALGVAALLAFLVRTPVKVVLVDRRRRRWLPRTRLASVIAGVELTLVVGIGAFALATSGWEWLVPVGIAAPLVCVELWFDMRSRSRGLVPELCGAVGIAGAAAAIALAGGAPAGLAAALWLVLAGRVFAAVPFVRTQIRRLHDASVSFASSDAAQGVGVAVAVAASVVDPSVVAGSVAVVLLALAQLVWVRRPPVAAKVVGITQMLLGLAVVGATAAGVHLA